MAEQVGDSWLYLVIFQEDEQQDAPETIEAISNRAGDAAVDHLELELKRTQEQLQSIIEEFESSNEELKSSNEELLSMNEELQSSNEELETAKEELQSVNEELETVNVELKLKVDELAHANSDIRNLFENTRIATLFLDIDLRIRNFTPATSDLFSLIDTDRGRPIGHITPRFRCDDLSADLSEVIRTLVVKERQVESHEGGWFIMRILPYRSTENVIEGVVVTFTDITQLKRAELEVQRLNRAADEQLRWMKTLMEVIPVGIAYHTSSVPGVRINRAAGDMLGLPAEPMPTQNADGLARVIWRNRIVPAGASSIFDVLVALEPAHDRRLELVSPTLGARQLVVQAATFETATDGSLAQVSAFIDITEIQRAREEAIARERQQAVVAELGLMALGSSDLEDFFRTALELLAGVAHADACEVLRLSGERLEPVSRIGFSTENSAPVPLTPSLQALMREVKPDVLNEESERSLAVAPLRELGLKTGVRVVIASHDGRPYGLLSVYTRETREFSAQDLTFLRAIANVFATAVQRQELEDTRLREREAEAMRRSEMQLRRAERLASLGTFATGIAHELNNPLNNIALAADAMGTEADATRQEKLLIVIRSNAERCGRIIESVLRFARDEDSRKWPIDLNALLQHATEIASTDFDGARLTCELNLDKDLPRLRCNPTELEQVFINMIRNAVQAQPGHCTIAITTENTPGGARITVSDNGPGIPQKDLAHIFDPFFSTKRRSGGTGLGLSITHRIVTAHGGVVRASSDTGKGAKFVIEIPFGHDDDEQEDSDDGESAPSG
jgi:signal transduction histidine kinase/PAS domain-containing protein